MLSSSGAGGSVIVHAEDMAAVSTTAKGSGAWDATAAAEVSGAGGAKATGALLVACLAMLSALHA